MGKPAENLRDNSAFKKAESASKFLVASPSQRTRDRIVDSLRHFVVGAEFSFANDGSEALFKLSNDVFQIVFLDDDLPKRNGIQIVEWLGAHDKLTQTAVVILSDALQKFVDDIVIGRVQFVPDVGDQSVFEKAVSRALNYVSHGDQAQFHMKFLATGEVLMRQGEAAQNVYLVKKGRLKAVLKGSGPDQVLGHVEVGEFVGEMAYINGEPRLADVAAETPCELIEIPITHLDHILFQRPAWSKALMKTLSKRLKVRDLNEKEKK